MGREEQVRDAKCTRPSLPVEGLAPRLTLQGVVTAICPVLPPATAIKVFDR